MEYSERQLEWFKASFAKRRRNQLWMTIPLVAIIAAFAFTQDRESGTALGMPAESAGPILIVAVAAALIFSFRNWRCPACNRYLGRAFNPRHCHGCGVQLRR